MTDFRPFCGIRPKEELAHKIAVVPHEKAYRKPDEKLEKMLRDGGMIQDENPCYYLYELDRKGNIQTGLVGCVSIDDYLNGRIRKHENTTTGKEKALINYMEKCRIQTSPIFLTHRENQALSDIYGRIKEEKPLYSFFTQDGVRHRIWNVQKAVHISEIRNFVRTMSELYIADGHHRAASAVKIGLKRRAEDGTYTGEEEYNYMLSVLFSSRDLKIWDYNRYVHDLNGNTVEQFLGKVRKQCELTIGRGLKPKEKGTIRMYVNHTWYTLTIKTKELKERTVDSLDVVKLQNRILAPILGITQPKTDERLEFIGGMHGCSELKRLVDEKGGVAFSMYPTDMEELFAVADEGLLMPPKSTWIEPKLKNGLFIHRF